MNRLFCVLICFLLVSSCKSPRHPQDQNQNLPKALEDKSSSYEIISKRSYEDLVESLYTDAVEKNLELKEFENRIQMLLEGKKDSLSTFEKFNTKNQSYYDAANNHIDRIKDSVLRERMAMLIKTSLLRYKAFSGRHSGILNYIEKQETSLNDLHQTLKVIRTLPMIEAFQKDYLPSIIPLQNFADSISAVVQTADSLNKR